MKRVFVTGAGAPGAPGIIKALQQARFDVYTGDCNPTASGRFLSKSFTQLPVAGDPAFVPFLLSECRRSGIDILLPLVTKELLPLAKAKSVFEKQGTLVIVSDSNQLKIVNDKGQLHRHLAARSIPVPSFEIVSSADELRKAVAGLGYPHMPVCVKPVLGNGSRGIRILKEDTDDFDLLFNHKPTHLFTRLSWLLETISDKPLPELLVSEYLPGEEFTIDAILQNGVPKLILPRSRGRMVQGISTQGKFTRQDEIIQYCDQILRSFHLSGPIGLQVKANTQGAFRLLEINPRLQGTSVAALGAGINLPELAVRQAFGPVEIDANSIKWGTSFTRYYSEVFY